MASDIIFPDESEWAAAYEWNVARDCLCFHAIVNGQNVRFLVTIEAMMSYWTVHPPCRPRAIGKHAVFQEFFRKNRSLIVVAAESHIVRFGVSAENEIRIASLSSLVV